MKPRRSQAERMRARCGCEPAAGADAQIRDLCGWSWERGRHCAPPSCDDYFAQRQTQDGGLVGMLCTMTCSLVTAAAQPCIDAFPIPAKTNEMGVFSSCVDSLVRTYGSIDLLTAAAFAHPLATRVRRSPGPGLGCWDHGAFLLAGVVALIPTAS